MRCFADFMYLQDGSQPVLNPYATLPHNVAKAALQQQAQQQHTYAMPYATQMDPMLSSQTIYQTPSQQIPFSIAQQQVFFSFYVGCIYGANVNTFCLMIKDKRGRWGFNS